LEKDGHAEFARGTIFSSISTLNLTNGLTWPDAFVDMPYLVILKISRLVVLVTRDKFSPEEYAQSMEKTDAK
jgi:hypothetical protein